MKIAWLSIGIASWRFRAAWERQGRALAEMKFRARWTWPWGPPFVVRACARARLSPPLFVSLTRALRTGPTVYQIIAVSAIILSCVFNPFPPPLHTFFFLLLLFLSEIDS